MGRYIRKRIPHLLLENQGRVLFLLQSCFLSFSSFLSSFRRTLSSHFTSRLLSFRSLFSAVSRISVFIVVTTVSLFSCRLVSFGFEFFGLLLVFSLSSLTHFSFRHFTDLLRLSLGTERTFQPLQCEVLNRRKEHSIQ